jgi:hypothetical protein
MKNSGGALPEPPSKAACVNEPAAGAGGVGMTTSMKKTMDMTMLMDARIFIFLETMSVLVFRCGEKLQVFLKG